MRTQLSEAEKADLLFTKMKGSKALETEVKQYRQAGHRTPYANDHTHEFLIESIENFVADHREEKNRKQRQDAHKAKVTSSANANAATVGDPPPKNPKTRAAPAAAAQMKELVETTVNACAAAFARPSPQKRLYINLA